MPVNYASVYAAKSENLVIVADGCDRSARYSNCFDKRGHAVRGDLGVVQNELGRHSNLPFRFSKWIEKGGGGSALRVLLVGCSCSGNCVLGKFRGRRTMHHRVRVLDAYPVGSVVVFHNVHHGIVGAAM